MRREAASSISPNPPTANALPSSTTSARPGLYVHVPFCLSKCPYCDFYSIRGEESAWEGYVVSLEQEAALHSNSWGAFDTLYLGGGTPSSLPGPLLMAIFDLLRRNFSFDYDTEITLEANPGDLTPEKLEHLRGLGITRINLGVQSFDDRELSFLGRRHGAAGALKAVEELYAAGFKQVGLDLIYGLPGQEARTWRKSLDQALAFEAAHLSCYMLTLKKGTPFEARLMSGDWDLPGEEITAAFFLETSEFLESQGYEHYEVSNYARGRTRRSRHNQKYWQRAPYLGLGPAAHSFDGARRWWNYADLAAYRAALVGGTSPTEAEETLTPEQHRLEALCLGLRTSDGMELGIAADLPEANARLKSLEAENLIRLDAGRIRPTRRGLLMADGLARLLA